MNLGPHDLAGYLNIDLPNGAGTQSILQTLPKQIEALQAGVHDLIMIHVWLLVLVLQLRRTEGHNVVVGVCQSEFYVSAEALCHFLIGCQIQLSNGKKDLTEFGKHVVADALNQFFLVFEVEVDGGRRVFDAISNLADRHVLVAVHDKKLGGCLLNSLAQFLFFAASSFLCPHGDYNPTLMYWTGFRKSTLAMGV